MTELAVAMAVIAALIGGFLVGALQPRGGKSAANPAEHDVRRAAPGALVPVSPPRPLPDLAMVGLERLPGPVSGQAALVIDFSDRLSSELQLARSNGTLHTIKGPVANALASLLSNEQIMNTVLGKA